VTGTPEVIRILRSVYGYSIAREQQRRREAAARKPGRRLHEQRQRRLVEGVAIILRRGDPTPFAFEGFVVAGLRGGLVLEGGWRWRDADLAARDIVRLALARIGARRPSWREASTPHYAQADAFTFFERSRCRQCGWQLPPENRVFCSARCNVAFQTAAWRRRQEDERRTVLDAA